MMNQLILANQELNTKEMEMENLRSQSDQLNNQLTNERELLEWMKKSNEEVRYFEELMRSPRSSSDTSILGHIKNHSSTREGETSKSGEKSNQREKGKPTRYHCYKMGHTINICKNKTGKENPKPKFFCQLF